MAVFEPRLHKFRIPHDGGEGERLVEDRGDCIDVYDTLALCPMRRIAKCDIREIAYDGSDQDIASMFVSTPSGAVEHISLGSSVHGGETNLHAVLFDKHLASTHCAFDAPPGGHAWTAWVSTPYVLLLATPRRAHAASDAAPAAPVLLPRRAILTPWFVGPHAWLEGTAVTLRVRSRCAEGEERIPLGRALTRFKLTDAEAARLLAGGSGGAGGGGGGGSA